MKEMTVEQAILKIKEITNCSNAIIAEFLGISTKNLSSNMKITLSNCNSRKKLITLLKVINKIHNELQNLSKNDYIESLGRIPFSEPENFISAGFLIRSGETDIDKIYKIKDEYYEFRFS